MIRWAVAAVLATTLPAGAGCIIDEGAANFSASVVALTRLCPAYRAASDQVADDLFVASGAVGDDEVFSMQCRQLVGYRIVAAEASVRGRPGECKKFDEMVAGSAGLREVLDIYGLRRPADGLTDDERLTREIEEALRTKGIYTPKRQ